MKWWTISIICITLILNTHCAWCVRGNDARVGDSYARGSVDGKTWEIGTSSWGMIFKSQGSAFKLVSYKNKLTEPATEYVDSSSASAPFALSSLSSAGRYIVDIAWTKYLPSGATANPESENLKLQVKKGDLIGFSVGPHGNYSGDETQWITTLDYGDGDVYTSSDDKTLDQGPIWFYYVRKIGTGVIEPIDNTQMQDYAEENVRVPSENSGFRSPGDTPHVGSTKYHPSPVYEAVRVWKAPKDGEITIRGEAKHFKGYGDTDVSVIRISEKPEGYMPPRMEENWLLRSGNAYVTTTGGRPAVQLDLTLSKRTLVADVHLLAYPHTSVVRQWIELTNKGKEQYILPSLSFLNLAIAADKSSKLNEYWLIGGNSGPTQGMLQSAVVNESYRQSIDGTMTDNYVPWVAFQRNSDSSEGIFAALEYLGAWQIETSRDGNGPVSINARLSELSGRSLNPHEQIALPVVTLGVFRDNLDDMSARVYDWQYEYLWDYTHDDWYGLMSYPVAWWPNCANLHENFAGRLAHLDMSFTDKMRGMGWEMLWDDAGWSENPNIWSPSREGPDFAQTLRYLDRTGMKWLLWFCGFPTSGVMDTKVGSWGNFQWRTDGVGGFNVNSDPAFRDQITNFLEDHPRSSFHTCSGGGRYSHTFDIQRYTDVNYFSDGGRGEQTNHYFSYLDTPDKWLDVITAFHRSGRYDPYMSRQLLTMTPTWDLDTTPDEQEQLRLIGEIYHYLTREGVAGRWSRVAHPVVKGDLEHQYFERTSYDRTKACIILKHKADGPVTIYPRGLIPDLKYKVGFDSNTKLVTRTGADLMANGITITDQKPGELIYLNLPNRPGSGTDKVVPKAPTRVLTRRETNIGHTGVGVYWSPGSDNNWISYYEVKRGDKLLGKVSWGTYYFDHAQGWDTNAVYSVRAVDGDNAKSGWITSSKLADAPLEFAALGGHFSDSGREGWSAEISTDGKTFQPMTWVPSARSPAGDTGGTANQVGGAEGYWEGAGTARVGRGWQQASTDALCARTWTASTAGNIRIIGRVMKEYYHHTSGGQLRIRILKNAEQLWPAQDWSTVPVSDLTGVSHDLATHVSAGDTIRFVLDKGSSPENDIIGWMPRIIYTSTQTASKPGKVVRILCGSKTGYTDKCGNKWSADEFFQGGKPASYKVAISGALPTNDDQTLYQHGRMGKDFTYSIPAAPGLYTVRLKLAEPKYQFFFQRPMNVDINGRRMMTNVDICHAARGSHKAYERLFRYVVPDANGKINLRFTGGWEPNQATTEALVQAIEILPEEKSTVRIDCGSDTDFIDWNSFIWAKDNNQSGKPIRSTSPVKQASPTLYDQELYRTATNGRLITYKIPVSAGLYIVHLKFAELWLTEPGKRPMTITVNGKRFRRNWDPAQAAGELGMSADVRIEDITPDKNGFITIQIRADGPNDAILQGIEIE